MNVKQIRLELYRWLAKRTAHHEIRAAYDWDDEEIESIEYLMAEKFDERATTLFYRNGGVLIVSFGVLYWLVGPISVSVLGLVFVLYGALVMGASLRGPYRIALEQRAASERYEVLKHEMARETMLVTMGAIFFVAGFLIQIVAAVA